MKIKYHDINILGLFVKYFEIWLFDYFYNFKKYLYLQNSILYKKYIKKIDIIDISLYQNVF